MQFELVSYPDGKAWDNARATDRTISRNPHA
jgi:hypothetical protein